MRDRPHNEVMLENYRADPAFAATMLNAILEDGDADELQDVLQQMNIAFGDGSGECRDSGCAGSNGQGSGAHDSGRAGRL